jgi:hypothetical protein
VGNYARLLASPQAHESSSDESCDSVIKECDCIASQKWGNDFYCHEL